MTALTPHTFSTTALIADITSATFQPRRQLSDCPTPPKIKQQLSDLVTPRTSHSLVNRSSSLMLSCDTFASPHYSSYSLVNTSYLAKWSIVQISCSHSNSINDSPDTSPTSCSLINSSSISLITPVATQPEATSQSCRLNDSFLNIETPAQIAEAIYYVRALPCRSTARRLAQHEYLHILQPHQQVLQHL